MSGSRNTNALANRARKLGVPFLALRPDYGSDDTLMDDIVIEHAGMMFRAEAMNDHAWYVACYLPDDQSVTFWVAYDKNTKSIRWTLTDALLTPGRHVMEPGR